MMYIPDPSDYLTDEEEKQERYLRHCPHCSGCGEAIQAGTQYDGKAVRINGEWYCDDCLSQLREKI